MNLMCIVLRKKRRGDLIIGYFALVWIERFWFEPLYYVLGKKLTLTVPFFTQVYYKWVLANLMLDCVDLLVQSATKKNPERERIIIFTRHLTSN